MFKKIKDLLGIEGVKLELILPEDVVISEGKVEGKIRFYSKNTQSVTAIRIKLVERYTRGRRDDKKTDEYELGRLEISKTFEVPATEMVEIDFKLPFSKVKSEMDDLEETNFVVGRLVKTAKWIRGVNSEYRVEAEADVKGTALNPFDKKAVHIV